MDTPPRRAHVATFGCRVNQADSEGILRALEDRAFVASESHADADVVVINSCTVTHRSDADIRKLVHRIQRENPDARVVVTGCYAQRDPDAVRALEGVAAVVGNSHSPELGPLVDRLCGDALAGESADGPIVLHSAMEALDAEDLPPVDPVAVVHDRTRPFIKIQDGCDAACTYCIIPNVRGAARSAPPDRVLAAVARLIAQGHFEIVLAGIHLGTYGAGLSEPASLADLVRGVLALPGLGRLRLSCIEPMAFPVELASLSAEDPRLAPHFHLPLQAGCDRTLKRMARPYRAADFRAQLDDIRTRRPDACIGTDVIVGFPGETPAEFEETRAFLETCGVDYIHVFSYSDRPGAPSTRLGPKVDPRRIKERSTALHELGARLWARYLDAQIGRTLPAVTLDRDPDAPGVIAALSENYCSIRCDDGIQGLTPNTPVRVRVTGRAGSELLGEARPARPLRVLAG